MHIISVTVWCETMCESGLLLLKNEACVAMLIVHKAQVKLSKESDDTYKICDVTFLHIFNYKIISQQEYVTLVGLQHLSFIHAKYDVSD